MAERIEIKERHMRTELEEVTDTSSITDQRFCSVGFIGVLWLALVQAA